MSRLGNGFDDLGHEPPLEPKDDPEMICDRCGGYMDPVGRVWVCHNPPSDEDLGDEVYHERKDGAKECIGMFEPDEMEPDLDAMRDTLEDR